MINLLKRTISGAAFVIIIVASLLICKYTYAAVLVAMTVISMLEFYRMTMGKRYLGSQVLSILAAVILFMLTFAYRGFDFPGRLVILAVVPIFVVMINSLYAKDKTEFGKFANLYTAILYIAVPLAMTNFIVFNASGDYDGRLLLSFFIIIWASDIGGYLFGMSLGQKFGKKLWPEISPKKSWIGVWGGLLMSVAAAVVLNLTGVFHYEMYHCIIMAILMDITGVYGDLIESQWKRHYCIKDSGHIMPGHGGMLDRLDSAFLAIPTGVIYLVVINVL